jgi:hypothetical protein
MSSPQQNSVTVPDSQLTRAAQLAAAMTANPAATAPSDSKWTVQDVLATALNRGLDDLERMYGAAADASPLGMNTMGDGAPDPGV